MYFVGTIMQESIGILENTPFPRGEEISADVIWGENMNREREKGENIKEKERKGKKRKWRKWEVKG
jgi:hypothetical protein